MHLLEEYVLPAGHRPPGDVLSHTFARLGTGFAFVDLGKIELTPSNPHAKRCTMIGKGKLPQAITAADLMSRTVVPLPQEMPLRDAALVLRRARISGAPVVDQLGRCVGVLSTADFLRWAEQEGRSPEAAPLPACPYQVKGRLLTGEEAVICTLAEGDCPLQAIHPTTGGRHTALCKLSSDVPSDRQQGIENLPGNAVRRYMTADIVTAGPQTTLPRLARMMIDAHIHRIIVVDEDQSPIGVVSSTDLLAALAYSDDEQESSGSTLHEATHDEWAGSVSRKGMP
jgi:CBS domain-containing protein